MKNPRLIRNIFACLLLAAVSGLVAQICPAQVDNSAAVTELGSLLKQHDDALAQKNLDALMALYAEGNNTVMMGTGPGERWEGKEAIREAFGQIVKDYDKSAGRDCYWRNGGVNGDMAWVAAMCKMSDTLKNKKREYELNISAVFEKQNGAWRVRAMHYSNVVSVKKP